MAQAFGIPRKTGLETGLETGVAAGCLSPTSPSKHPADLPDRRARTAWPIDWIDSRNMGLASVRRKRADTGQKHLRRTRFPARRSPGG